MSELGGGSGAAVRAALAAGSSPKCANARSSAERFIICICLASGPVSARPGGRGLRCCGRLVEELSAPTLRGKLGSARKLLWHEVCLAQPAVEQHSGRKLVGESGFPAGRAGRVSAMRLACSTALPGGHSLARLGLQHDLPEVGPQGLFGNGASTCVTSGNFRDPAACARARAGVRL